jgi:hypothetical protein
MRGTSGIALGLSVVARAGGYTDVNAYRATLRLCAAIALGAVPLAGCLERLHVKGYPNPWTEGERADGGGGSLPPVVEVELSDAHGSGDARESCTPGTGDTSTSRPRDAGGGDA